MAFPAQSPVQLKLLSRAEKIIVAKDNEDEVGLINGEGCLIADHLQAVCAFLEG